MNPGPNWGRDAEPGAVQDAAPHAGQRSGPARSTGTPTWAAETGPATLPTRSFAGIEHDAPPRRLRWTLQVLVVLCAALLAGAALGELDIIASAEGKLVPQGFIKIVQPAEGGVVQAILVREGQRVAAGEVLLRMDAGLSTADQQALLAQLDHRRLQLQRIAAELNDVPLQATSGATSAALAAVLAQMAARRQQYLAQRTEAQHQLERSEHELASARATQLRLQQALPHLQDQAERYAQLGGGGFFPVLQVREKQRAWQEKRQELAAQDAIVAAHAATLAQARVRLAQVTTAYRSALQDERVEAETQLRRLEAEAARLAHRRGWLELKAPQAGVVKDLVTHTEGTVVNPGTILLTLVPEGAPLLAEVRVRNDDIGFVRVGQPVRLKLAPYAFQKFGLLDGTVAHLGPDAADTPGEAGPPARAYKALVHLQRQHLIAADQSLSLAPGMAVTAEIHQGRRSALEYLLAPLQRTWHDAARER